MEVQVAFVIGTPGETWQDLEDSFALATQYPVWRADWNHLYAYPGTELFEWARKESTLSHRRIGMYFGQEHGGLTLVSHVPLLRHVVAEDEFCVTRLLRKLQGDYDEGISDLSV